MDRISHLPESINHHILSFFNNLEVELARISQLPESIKQHILSSSNPFDAPPVELVRMSVLSKTWFHLTASFPILDFNIHKFTSRECFFKYVEYTTSRFCNQNVTADKFKLVTTLLEPAEIDVVNRCLELILQKGVRELVIDLSDPSESHYASANYRLPNILLSASVLTSLALRDCLLPSSLTVDAAVMFKSMIKLRLENVPIDDEAIVLLASSCPLLIEFEIRCCPGFKTFCVHGHQSLRTVWVEYYTPVESIDIEAPNLSCLVVNDCDERGAPQMNLASCKKLTRVSYFGHPLPNSNGFTHFLSNFPFIQTFVLVTQYPCNNLRLSSHSLRTLILRSNCDLEKLEFRTPKLVSFCYPFNHNILWPLVWHSTHLKPCMQIYPDDHIDTLWFQKLRQFLDKKNGFKVFNLFIHAIYDQKLIDLEKLKAIELPPYELEHVELQLEAREESADHVAFVDAVLWCCRPRSLTFRSSFPSADLEEQSDLVKFTYEKLLEQEDQGHTNFQIASSSYPRAQRHFRVLTCERKAISFTKLSKKKLDNETANGITLC